jgi:hypothetical protein
VDDKKAAPAIEQYLANHKQEELARVELKRLRDAAKIDYVGDFSKYAGDAASPTPVAAAGSAAAGAGASAAASASAAAPANGEDKGIAALK